MVSLDNYFVIRKNPKGGFSYVEGHETDPKNRGMSIYVDIPVTDVSKVYETFDECMTAALEDNAEYGVVTHPECSLDDVLSEIKSFQECDEFYDNNGVQIKKNGKVIKEPVFELLVTTKDE